jgi:sialate O-acetylesterase
MDGRAHKKDLPGELAAPQTDIRFFYRDAWTFLQPGSSWRIKQPELFGPEISFGRNLAERYSTRQFALVKHAKGGTSLAEEWNPKTGAHYKMLFDKIQTATAELARKGVAWEIVGFVWMQGERDADFATYAAAYADNFLKFIAAVRRDLHQPALPFVFGQIHAPTYPFRLQVREAQAKVARSVKDSRMVRTDDLPMQADQTHYDAGGFVLLGRRFAGALSELLK